jgi:phosphocarrier protein
MADRVHADVTVLNPLGMHARPSATLVQTAGSFPCDVWLEKGGVRVNAKSVMGLLMLAAAQGAELRIVCDGERSADALSALKALFDDGFGEVEGIP